jgi:CAAX amino terminal protease family.
MDRSTPAALAHPVRALIVGYLLAFAVPWTVWGTLIAEQHGLLGWHLPQGLAFWLGLPVATIAAGLAGGGWPSLRAIIGRLFTWRTGWRSYLAAIALAAGVPLLVFGFARLAQIDTPSEVLPVTAIPATLVIETLMFWLTEEALWRGFAQPAFQHWLNPALAAAIVGVLWALWHLPLFAIRGSFQAELPYGGFFVLTVATAVILGWLFASSGGSVVVCAVFHGVVDVTFAASGVLSASPLTFWAVVGFQCLAALLLWRHLAGASLPVSAH